MGLMKITWEPHNYGHEYQANAEFLGMRVAMDVYTHNRRKPTPTLKEYVESLFRKTYIKRGLLLCSSSKS